MNAFQQAMQAIAADPNQGQDAIYTPGPGRTGLAVIAVRVVLSRPFEATAGFGAIGAVAPAAVAVIAIDALPYQPRRNDTLQIGGTGWRVETPEADPVGASWTLPLAAT